MPLDILLVDDNRDSTELLQELLSMEGHRVRTAATAADALALARELPAQVFLVDQNLPDMPGSELAPLLRQAAAQQGVRSCFAIAITGAAAGVSAGAQGSAFDYVLGKPLDFDAFDTILGRCAEALRSGEGT